jgi:hypothetical protein
VQSFRGAAKEPSPMQQCNNIPREFTGAGFVADCLSNRRYSGESGLPTA